MSFPLPTSTTASSSGFSFGLPITGATATIKPFGFSAGGVEDISKLPNFSLGAGATQPAATTTLNNSVSSAANTASTQGNFANLSTATKTADSAAISHASQLSYNQLAEDINKWTLELEELDKIFTEQATQINAWDTILFNNRHKIIELDNAVQKVKADQQLFEQELEFIDIQHKELVESIAPLQEEFTNLPQVDDERSQTCLLAETLDTQLKQISEQLKGITDSLNEANKGQDNKDPIKQTGQILTAHMRSLQWVESSSTIICNKLDDIAKMQELLKCDAYPSAFYK